MAITSSQAVRITKVKIPDRKSFARSLSEFYAALAPEWRSPFLLVGGIRNGSKVWLTYENNYYAGNDYEIETFDFDLKDLDLYDLEAANPTSHPLSAEEVIDQVHRDYFMADGKEKILQDALNRMCSWSKNDTFKHEKPVLAKPTQDEKAELTWEQENEVILADAKFEAQFAPLQAVFDGLESIMRYKNRQYGNTALEPIGVFSKGDTLEKLLSRADDKVARIQNSPMLRKNDVVDLLGYLVLICAHQGWNNFLDQQD